MRLDHTRSSARWGEKPGNWDRLNLVRVYESSNSFGIPDLPLNVGEAARLVAYNDRYKMTNPKEGDYVHFFLDDYRFETMWTLPGKSISKVARVGAALTPDFSLWSEMPWSMQVWQIYRSRWVGAWMAEHGIKVIPTVTWGDERSFEFAFLGIPTGSTVAISTVGVVAKDPFRAGLHSLIAAVKPAKVLVYGTDRRAEDLMGACSVEVVRYSTRWILRKGEGILGSQEARTDTT